MYRDGFYRASYCGGCRIARTKPKSRVSTGGANTLPLGLKAEQSQLDEVLQRYTDAAYGDAEQSFLAKEIITG